MSTSKILKGIAELGKRKLAIAKRIGQLNTMSKNLQKVGHILSDNFKFVGTFSDSDDESVKVWGELIRPGNYRTGIITREHLEIAYNRLIQHGRLLLFTNHMSYWRDEDTNVLDIVGELRNFRMDLETGAIIYDGEICDNNLARKVRKGLVNGISAGFMYDTNEHGENFDIDIREATITFKPHSKNAFIELVA